MKTYKDVITRAQDILGKNLADRTTEPNELNKQTLVELVGLFDGSELREVEANEQNKTALTISFDAYQALATRTLNAEGRQHFFFIPEANGPLWPRVKIAQMNRAVDLLHGALGLAGEVGELIDTIKKAMFYGKPLDEENVREELGDILWYVFAPFARAARCNISEIALENISKLSKRYPERFTELHAVARLDKQEETILPPHVQPRPMVLQKIGSVNRALPVPEGWTLRTGLSQEEKHKIMEKYCGQTVDFSDGFYWDNDQDGVAPSWQPCPELFNKPAGN